jgi:iron complex transport system substrate-binding protein
MAFQKLAIIMVILFALLLSGACAQEMLNITDCVGREVTVTADVTKVVSIYPDATRILVSLGAGDKIVGVDSYSKRCPILEVVYPQLDRITDVGTHISGTLSFESIASLKPDVIFVGGSSRDLADKIQKELGIPCVCSYFYVREIEDFLETYKVIGETVGEEERSEEVQTFIIDKLYEITSVSADMSDLEKPRVILIAVPFDDDPFKVATVSSAVDWAGGLNLGADEYKGGNPSKTATLEQIAQWDPDIIMVNGMSLVETDDILNDPNWMQLRAVNEKKVYRIFSGMVGYDPALFVVQPLNMAKIIHPEVFSFDFEDEANMIFEEVYGVNELCSVLEAEFGISKV